MLWFVRARDVQWPFEENFFIVSAKDYHELRMQFNDDFTEIIEAQDAETGLHEQYDGMAILCTR